LTLANDTTVPRPINPAIFYASLSCTPSASMNCADPCECPT